MTLWYIGIQDLESRYSTFWNRWLPTAFRKAGWDVKEVGGHLLTTTIEKGEFLDVNGSLFYTLGQIQEITKAFYSGEVKSGDVFFFADLEFPGHFESIRNLSVLNNIPVEMYAFLHASSVATTGDLAGKLQDWQKWMEIGWLRCMNGIFVGSEFFKRNLCEKLLEPYAGEDYDHIRDKIYVTGNPWNDIEIREMINPLPKKENIVIWPHRWSEEKNPQVFVNLAYALKPLFPDWKFIVTSSGKILKNNSFLDNLGARALDSEIEFYENLTKKQYYELIAKSKIMVSCSKFESFGYTALEASTFRTASLCYKETAYGELLNEIFLYADHNELFHKLARWMKDYPEFTSSAFYPQVKYADESIDRIIDIIGWQK